MFETFLGLLRKPYLAVLASLLLCFLLFSPAVDVPVTPGLLNDKVAHCLMFLGTSFLWFQRTKNSLLAVIVILAFAVASEYIQASLPAGFRRSFEFNDILADISGIGFAYFASRFFDNFFRKREGKNHTSA